MKITNLRLNNFGSHVQTWLDFTAPITMVVGSLNSGKSTLLNAIEYALVGECGYYRKKTDDRTDLIHSVSPAPSFAVSVQADKHLIQRSRSRDNQETWAFADRPMATVSAMDTAVTDALGVSKTILSAVLNVSNFFELDAATQKELIIGLIGAEVTHAKVCALFTGEPESLKLLQGQVNSLQAIANAYQYAYDRRTVVRRELKELKPPPPPDGPAPPLDKIRALLAQLDSELQTKIAERAKLEGAGQVTRVIDDLTARRNFLIGSAEAKGPDPAVESTLKNALQAERDARAQAGELCKSFEMKARTMSADILVRERNIKLLATFDGRCVAGDHACPAPKGDMEKALNEQTLAHGKAVKAIDQVEKEMATLASRRDNPQAERQADMALSQYQLAKERAAATAREITQIDQQLKNMVVPDSSRMASLATEIGTLKERIAKGRQQLESANNWLERERQVKAVAETRAKLERELAGLEELVKFFGPTGVKVQLIDERIGQFEDQINQHLKAFGYEMKVQIEPWRLIVSERPITRLSRSERFRLGICFQIALAKMTGLNFIACDDVEMLTPAVRTQMIRMVLEAKLDQCLIIMTLMDEGLFRESAKKFPPAIEAFMVENVKGVSQVSKVVKA